MTGSFLDVLLAETGGSEQKGRGAVIKQSVANNIRFLLESRQCQMEVAAEYPLVGSALYGYGLSARYLNRSLYQGNRLCRELEQKLRQYEPRLKEVEVEMVQLNQKSNCICFRIEGVLQIGAGQVPVGFESELNVTNTRLTIEEACIV